MIMRHQRLIERLAGKRFEEMKKLNLGCGSDYREGWVNLDLSKKVGKVDVFHDLTKLPLPFKDNTFDYIFSAHTLEHIQGSLTKLICELWRIAKPNGVIEIRVPHSSCCGALDGFEHKNIFSISSFFIFTDTSFLKHIPNFPDFKKPLFEMVGKKLMYQRIDDGNRFLVPKEQQGIYHSVARLISFLANLNPKFCERVWCYWVGGFQEMQIILKKIPQEVNLEKNYLKKLVLLK